MYACLRGCVYMCTMRHSLRGDVQLGAVAVHVLGVYTYVPVHPRVASTVWKISAAYATVRSMLKESVYKCGVVVRAVHSLLAALQGFLSLTATMAYVRALGYNTPSFTM